MTKNLTKLIEAAKNVQGEFHLAKSFSAASVGAALMTSKGNLFTGVSLDVGCGIGFCAEHAAIADMLKHRETRIEAIVAVTQNRILPPCGRCRELMMQIDSENRDCQVIVAEDSLVALKDLLPYHWLKG